MALDPDTRKMLDMLASMGMGDIADLTPEQARAMRMTPPPAEPTPVGAVADRTLPSAREPIPVRV
jgi:acetyl esterase